MRAGTYRVSPCTHVMGSAVFWSGHGLTTEGWASVTELPESSTADIRGCLLFCLAKGGNPTKAIEVVGCNYYHSSCHLLLLSELLKTQWITFCF